MKIKLTTLLMLVTVTAVAAPLVTTIQMKRGTEANLPARAKMGEPLFTTDTHRVFVGTSSARVELFKLPAHNTYSTATQGKLNAKLNKATFDAYSGRGVPLATTIDATGTATFPTAATIYATYSSTVRKAGTAGGGSFASITGQPTDNTNLATALNAKASTSYVDTAIAGVTAGSLPSVSSDPAAPAAGYTWYNTTDHTLNVAQASGRTKFSGTYTAWDTTPDAFSFLDETGIAVLTTKTSAPVTIAGIDYPAAISVTGDTGYGYSKNSAACTATSGTVVAGDTVSACVTSSASGNTATTATVTVGGVSDTYSVTTAALVNWTDNFNRADENPLSNGGVWSKPSYASAVRVVSNRANGSTAAAQNIAYRNDWASNDQCSEIRLQQVNNNQGAAVRISPTVDSFYWIQAPDPITVKRRVTGTETTIITTATSSLSGDRLKICANGTTISVYKNDTLVDSVTDANISAGYPGFRMTQDTDYMEDSVVSAP